MTTQQQQQLSSPAPSMQQQTRTYQSSMQQQQSYHGSSSGAAAAYQPAYSSSYQQGAAYSAAGGASYATGGRMVTGGAVSSAGPERVQSTRKISSTIVNEQMMGPPPQDYPVREIEVPGPVQEIVTHVPRKEVIETERRVPKYEYEYVDKIVEVPRIEYVDKIVEVPRYQEVIVEKRVPQIVDVPREVVREVKIPKINHVEKTVEVPGQVIEVPKPYTVEQKVEFTRYTDKKKAVVVAQSVKPVIVEGAGVTEVDVYEYEPECVPVDVHVVKGVQAQVQAAGVIETLHRVVSVPSAQYNTILQQMNAHLSQAELQKLPYLQERGQTMFLGERFMTAEVQTGAVVQGLDMHNLVNTYVDHASRKVLPVNDPRVNMTGGGFVGGAGYSASAAGYSTGAAGYSTGGAGGYSTVSHTSGPMQVATYSTGPTQVTSYATGPAQMSSYRQEQHTTTYTSSPQMVENISMPNAVYQHSNMAATPSPMLGQQPQYPRYAAQPTY